MPPRQKKQAKDEDDESIEIEDDEEEQSPKKGAAKAKAAPKKRAAKGDEPDDDAPQPKKARAKKLTGPAVDELGWTCVPPSFIYRDFDSKPSTKVAGFDVDGCLILTKSGADFARNPDDWRFISKSVPKELQELHKKGYRIVLFSNQGGVKSALTGKAAATAKGKIASLLKEAGVPALVLLATGTDDFRKPSTGMWDYMCRELSAGVVPDKSQSFFVGDAAGRPTDFQDKSTGKPSQTDKDFAAAVGVPFKLPEEVFGEAAGKGGGNAELVAVFKELTDHYFSTGIDKDRFKAIAFRKVTAALSGFEDKIGAHNLKAVAALAGVGKGSLGVIKEFVDSGKVQELEDIRASKAGGSSGPKPAVEAGPATAAAKPSQAAQQALKFM